MLDKRAAHPIRSLVHNSPNKTRSLSLTDDVGWNCLSLSGARSLNGLPRTISLVLAGVLR